MTGSLSHLAAALCAFLLTHSISALKPVRARFVALLGERGYLATYSVVSLAVITWVVLALTDAPYVELWAMTNASMWATAILMIPACVFLVFGLTTPNPLSITIRPNAFEPDAPGILAVTRHPLLLGLALWAAAHIPPNGSLAAILVFGFAALFSVAGMFILDSRRQRAWGTDTWHQKGKQTSLLNLRPSALPRMEWRWGLVTVIYSGLIWLHPIVIGLSPLP